MKRSTQSAIILSAALLCAAALPAVHAAAADGDGWQEENGRRFYQQEGERLTGEAEIDGMPYLFAPNGALQTGWQTVNGKRYFYTRSGEIQLGWITWRGETYYVSQENGKLTSGQQPTDEGETAVFDDYGVVLKEWAQQEDGSWRIPFASGEITIDGVPYLLDDQGRLLAGVQTPSDGIARFYDAETRSVVTGAAADADGKQYLAGEDGHLLTGFQTLPDETVRYYDPETYQAVTGEQTIDGSSYLFDAQGVMQSGLYSTMGNTRYYGEDGKMQTGFVTLEDGTRYFSPDTGLMRRGIMTIGSDTYYFDSSGIMAIGWTELGNVKYYYDEEGKCVSGWTEIDGTSYYFTQNGQLVTKPTKIGDDIYVFNQDGLPVSGWYTTESGAKYYGNSAGIALLGWQDLQGYGYYFGTDGVMAVSTTIGDFTIDALGHARSSNAVKVDNYLAKITNKTPIGIFNYCVSNFRYYRNEATRTYTQLKNSGWDSLVKYILTNRRGVCYYLAATLDMFFQRAGYTCRMVHATHSTGNHYWNQVLIDGKWHNYDPTYSDRGDIAWSTQIAKGNYIILGYVDVHYDARGAYLGDTYTPYS